MPDSLPMSFPIRPLSPRPSMVMPCEVSPLMLSHELLNLAEEADRAGLRVSAVHLLELAHTVCDDRPAGAF